MKTQFDALLEDMDTLAKALPPGDEVDDEKIEAASSDDESEIDDEKTLDEDKEVKSGKASNKGKKPLRKALEDVATLKVTLADGTEVEAQDGTELVKALTEQFGALTERFDSQEGLLTKALGQLVTIAKAQAAHIETLTAKVKAIANEGRGRKATVSITEKVSTMAKSQQGEEGINPNEFMAKAEAKFKSGALAGNDLSYIEASYNRGDFKLPPALIAKVMAA